jgi:hypothetical protein
MIKVVDQDGKVTEGNLVWSDEKKTDVVFKTRKRKRKPVYSAKPIKINIDDQSK